MDIYLCVVSSHSPHARRIDNPVPGSQALLRSGLSNISPCKTVESKPLYGIYTDSRILVDGYDSVDLLPVPVLGSNVKCYQSNFRSGTAPAAQHGADRGCPTTCRNFQVLPNNRIRLRRYQIEDGILPSPLICTSRTPLLCFSFPPLLASHGSCRPAHLIEQQESRAIKSTRNSHHVRDSDTWTGGPSCDRRTGERGSKCL
jgi:hypothetical protein